MPAANPHQAAARIRKAAAIAALLVQHGITVEDASRLQAHQWDLVARLVEVNPPSAQTQLIVLTLLGAVR